MLPDRPRANRSGAIFVEVTAVCIYGPGAVAQLGERCIRIAEVRGSSPLSSTSMQEIEAVS